MKTKPTKPKGFVKTVGYPLSNATKLSDILKIAKDNNLIVEESELIVTCYDDEADIEIRGVVQVSPPSKEELTKYYTELKLYYEDVLEKQEDAMRTTMIDLENVEAELKKLT